MPRHDWLVGRDRQSEAAERIYSAAADLIARRGYEAFTIEALAAQVHCSSATIYRHAGGKAAIRDAVVAIQATRIVDTARQAIKGLTGSDRVVTATIVALQGLQSDPLAHLMQSMPWMAAHIDDLAAYLNAAADRPLVKEARHED